MAALTSLLVESAVSWSDGGGKVQLNLKPIRDQQAVARFWLSVARKNRRPLPFTLALIISLTLSAGALRRSMLC